MKCAEDHLTREFKKSRDAPGKCANCGSDHVAIYKNCPKAPQIKKPSTSYANALKNSSTASTTTTPTQIPSMAEMFTNFQIMYVQMEKVTKLMAAAF